MAELIGKENKEPVGSYSGVYSGFSGNEKISPDQVMAAILDIDQGHKMGDLGRKIVTLCVTECCKESLSYCFGDRPHYE